MAPLISVILSTHNPHPGRLARTLRGLRAQTLPAGDWELLIVDNHSAPPLEASALGSDAPPNPRILREPELGLTAARRCGLCAATGSLLVLVDDDNVLAPDYLAHCRALFAEHARLGAAGGRSLPEFEVPPAAWVHEFLDLLACRDLGESDLIAAQLWDEARRRNEYPPCAPIGAGMVLRREAVQAWLDQPPSALTDRRGGELSSGGDNDIILSLMQHGWQVGYFPRLNLTHLIPAARTTRDYLARLNRGIWRSWIQVLTRHDACPWAPIPQWTVPLRVAKAWFTYRAWSSPSACVRWHGARGHFEGRAAL